MTAPTLDIIACEVAVTLDGLLRERVRRTPGTVAYRHYDKARAQWIETTWAEVYTEVARWQAALAGEGLAPGDRVAVMVPNGLTWICFEQAALGLGLVVVPLYSADRAGNVAYVLGDADVRALVIDSEEMWNQIKAHDGRLGDIACVVSLTPPVGAGDGRPRFAQDWLPRHGGDVVHGADGSALATLVYSSGTSGSPKGIMLSHANILSNAWSGLQNVPLVREDLLLSFLPLSHMLERTVGYYAPMMAGAQVAFARSIDELAEDFVTVRPTILVSVPRIYERAYEGITRHLEQSTSFARWLFRLAVAAGWTAFERAQGRCRWRPLLLLWPLLRHLVARKILGRFGARLRIAISGGAAIDEKVATTMLALGVPILQGYGLTEASPIVSVNTAENNRAQSVGTVLPGLEVRIGEDEEILVRGPSVMMGYWRNLEASLAALDAEGWLHTGDKGRLEDGHLYIVGRIKDIIVLDNGEKVSPTDIEQALCHDPLVHQALTIGDSRPYLVALAVIAPGALGGGGADALERALLRRMDRQLQDFPGYVRVRRLLIADEPWTVENDLMTATLKLKREKIIELYRDRIEEIYRVDKHVLPD